MLFLIVMSATQYGFEQINFVLLFSVSKWIPIHKKVQFGRYNIFNFS